MSNNSASATLCGFLHKSENEPQYEPQNIQCANIIKWLVDQKRHVKNDKCADGNFAKKKHFYINRHGQMCLTVYSSPYKEANKNMNYSNGIPEYVKKLMETDSNLERLVKSGILKISNAIDNSHCCKVGQLSEPYFGKHKTFVR